MENNMKDQDLLVICKEYFNYNPETGLLTWAINRGRLAKIGGIAGSKKQGYSKTYIQIKIKGKNYYAHRIIFLIINGYLPKYIDHVNGDSLDNRPSNLRECTHSQNMSNIKIRRQNTSGYIGVSFHKVWKTWNAQIQTEGKSKFLGSFSCKHDAARAYNAAAKIHHGEFAYLNVIDATFEHNGEF